MQRRWRDLRLRQRIGFVAAGAAQLVPAGTAWADPVRRRPADVAGRTGVRAAGIAVDRVGPLAYLRWGHLRRDVAGTPGTRAWTGRPCSAGPPGCGLPA